MDTGINERKTRSLVFGRVRNWRRIVAVIVSAMIILQFFSAFSFPAIAADSTARFDFYHLLGINGSGRSQSMSRFPTYISMSRWYAY